MDKRQDQDRERKDHQSGNTSGHPSEVGAPSSQKPRDIESGSDRVLPSDGGSQKPIPGRSGLMDDEKRKRSDIDSPSR